MVSDTHSLWFDALLELGVLGTSVIVCVLLLFARRVWRGCRGEPTLGARATLQWGSATGLALLLLLGAGAGFFDVGALWLQTVCLAGLALGPPAPRRSALRERMQIGGVVLVAAAATLCWPDLLARHSAQRAEKEGDEQRLRSLERAARYGTAIDQLHLGLVQGTRESAPILRDAARRSGAWFAWLAAGDAYWNAGDLEQARAAWIRACDLDVLVPFAAFRLAQNSSGGVRVQALARALIAEPRIGGAIDVDAEVLADVAGRLEIDSELPAGWRNRLAEAVRELQEVRARVSRDGSGVDDPRRAVAALELGVDRGDLETSYSLFFHRRTARPLVISRIAVDAERAGVFDFVPAATSGAIDSAIWVDGCRLRSPVYGDGKPR